MRGTGFAPGESVIARNVNRLIRLVLVLALAGGLCAVPAAARATVYGAEVDGDFFQYRWGFWTTSQLQSSLTDLRATGATVGRSGADWAQTEPHAPVHGQHHYDWTYDDTVAGALATAHLRWQPMLDFTPRWARQHIKPIVSKTGVVSPIPPRNNQIYGAYVAAFARRYGPGGTFWSSHPALPKEPVTMFEIWNEPDDKWTWGPDVNLKDYSKMYAVARRAIKRADPRAIVMTGGLAFTPSSLPRLLRAVEGLKVDAFAIHPYARNAAGSIKQVRWAQAQLKAYGRGSTPIIINEYGWNRFPGSWQGVKARTLKSNVINAIRGLSQIPHVKAVIPFEWSNPNWGLHGGALATGISRARQARR
jgi:hypothetical protein